MALTPGVEKCLEALSGYNSTKQKLEDIRAKLNRVSHLLHSKLDSFFFSNIQTPSVSGITLASGQTEDGSNWPTPDTIQKLLVDCFTYKDAAIKASKELTPSERHSIAFPQDWRI